jgi:Ca-activated chloride channel family protein
MSNKILSCIGALLLSAFVAPAFSSAPSGATDEGRTKPQPEPVALLVTVTDSAGRLVTGLESQHFAIFENGVRQTITTFSDADAPFSLGVALAFSGNLKERSDQMREALKLFIERGHPDNEFFLASQATLDEAVALALGNVKQGRQPKRAMLVIADGQTRADAIALLKQTGVPVYSIGINEPTSGAPFPADKQALLTELAQATGGKAFFPGSTAELETALGRIALELRHQYRIGYTPASGARESQRSGLKVELNPPRGLPLLTLRVSQAGEAARK